MKFRVFAIFLVASERFLSYAGIVEAAHPKIISNGDPIEDSYIVVLKDKGVTISSVQARAEALISGSLSGNTKVTVTSTYSSVLRGFAVQMTASEAEVMADSDDIEYIEQNGKVYATEMSVGSWGLDRVDQRNLPLNQSYSPFGDGAGVHVYILDTGIRTSHDEFEGTRAIWGTNTVGDGNDSDCHGHGTKMAGTVAGKLYGIANKANVVAVKILGCNGSGTFASMLSGIEWIENNAQKPAVTNISIQSGTSTAINTAVTNLHNSGVPVVVAAGNNNNDACNLSPGGAEDVITAASIDNADTRSWFSDWGTCVNLFAPGEFITSASHTSDSQSATASGTSIATAHVSGAAALLLASGISPANVTIELESMATSDIISDVMGSPNLLLYVGGSDEPPSPPPNQPTSPPPNQPTSPPPTTTTTSQSPTSTTSGDCVDSAAFIWYIDALKACEYVADENINLCGSKDIQSFCPRTCGACDEWGCKDDPYGFYVTSSTVEGESEWTCHELANLGQNEIDIKCGMTRFLTTCRETCGVCITSSSIM